jgi:hypothetical protein
MSCNFECGTKWFATVAEIKTEQALVHASRELITRFEQKVQVTFACVWGEDAPVPPPRPANKSTNPSIGKPFEAKRPENARQSMISADSS